jgi:hypothetical protein
MPESAGARVDTHVHVHVGELTKEELEAKRQAEVAQEEEDERKKDEEEKTPASIRENPGQSDSPQKRRRLGKKQFQSDGERTIQKTAHETNVVRVHQKEVPCVGSRAEIGTPRRSMPF